MGKYKISYANSLEFFGKKPKKYIKFLAKSGSISAKRVLSENKNSEKVSDKLSIDYSKGEDKVDFFIEWTPFVPKATDDNQKELNKMYKHRYKMVFNERMEISLSFSRFYFTMVAGYFSVSDRLSKSFILPECALPTFENQIRTEMLVEQYNIYMQAGYIIKDVYESIWSDSFTVEEISKDPGLVMIVKTLEEVNSSTSASNNVESEVTDEDVDVILDKMLENGGTAENLTENEREILGRYKSSKVDDRRR